MLDTSFSKYMFCYVNYNKLVKTKICMKYNEYIDTEKYENKNIEILYFKFKSVTLNQLSYFKNLF